MASLIADGWLEIFESTTRVYGLAPANAMTKIELADGSVAAGLTEYSMQDRMVYGALEDPLEGWATLLGGQTLAIDIWREMMMPNRFLNWSPV